MARRRHAIRAATSRRWCWPSAERRFPRWWFDEPTRGIDVGAAMLGSAGSEERAGVLRGSARPSRSAAASRRLPSSAPYVAVARAASLAASPLLRNAGTVGGNLCQHIGAGTTAARSGTAGSAAARPATRRSATTADTTSSRAIASRRTRPTSPRRSPLRAEWQRSARRRGAREVPLLDLYRLPTGDNRSLLTLEPGELVSRPPPRRARGVCVRAAGRARRVLVSPCLGRRRGAGRRDEARRGRGDELPRELDPPTRSPGSRGTRRPPGSVCARDAGRAGHRGGRVGWS